MNLEFEQIPSNNNLFYLNDSTPQSARKPRCIRVTGEHTSVPAASRRT
jgi:hypothetical protein